MSLNETEPLVLAAVKSAKNEAKSDLSFVLKKTINNNVNLVKVKKAIDKPELTKMKAEDALALKVHCNLSDDQYQMIRNSSKHHHADIYPTLHKVFEEKKELLSKGFNHH